MRAFVPGIYARSEELVQATRDLDRGRTTPEDVDEIFERDLEAFVAAQEEAGLDLLSDGLLRWQDVFRPLAEATEGLDARPLVRFLDTNTFYRAVLVDGEPRFSRPLPRPELPAGGWVATLPSPLAFSRASDGAVSAETAASAVLAPQIQAYTDAECPLVVLAEPFAARDDVPELLGALAALPDGVPLALWLPFTDASHLLERLADAPVAAIGVDFYLTPLDALPRDYPKEVLAGIVDARRSLVEDLDEIGHFVEAVLQRSPAGVALVPNGDLQFVAEPIAREKVLRLGQARSSLAEAA
jgi:5-methyltetrahydropteroyltriglutamate--homocysteine methyltransferase